MSPASVDKFTGVVPSMVSVILKCVLAADHVDGPCAGDAGHEEYVVADDDHRAGVGVQALRQRLDGVQVQVVAARGLRVAGLQGCRVAGLRVEG